MSKSIFESRYRDRRSQLLYTPLKKILRQHDSSPQKKIELEHAQLSSTLSHKFQMLDETASNTIVTNKLIQIKEARLPEEVLLDESHQSPERIRARNYTIIDVTEHHQTAISEEEFKQKMKNLTMKEIVYKYATDRQKDWGKKIQELQESRYIVNEFTPKKGEVYPTGPNRSGRLTNEKISKLTSKLNMSSTPTNPYKFDNFSQKRALLAKPIKRNFYSCMDDTVNNLENKTKCSLLASRVEQKWQ